MRVCKNCAWLLVNPLQKGCALLWMVRRPGEEAAAQEGRGGVYGAVSEDGSPRPQGLTVSEESR